MAQAQAATGAAMSGRAAGAARNFRGTNLDLVLATVIALGLPFAAARLFHLTGGALAALALYYGVCCVGVVLWRRKTLDYRAPARWPWGLLALCALVPLANAAINVGNFPVSHATLFGFLVTLLIWAPLNAAMEQLAWFYVFDAWRTRWSQGTLRWVGFAVGLALLLFLVAMIHIMFWLLFLPNARPNALSPLTVPINLLLTLTYGVLYYRTGSMWPVWVIHLLADAQLVILAHYSILPYLL